MKIAALVVTCNRKKMLSALLEDLLNQSRRPDEIIVVDNGSEDGTSEFIRERYPDVQLLELEQNSGLFGGLEIGINYALKKGNDAVWLIDDDATPRKDALECLLNTIYAHEGLEDAVIWCANITPEGSTFTEPVGVKVDGEWKIYNEPLPELDDKVYETPGGPNIGIYIPRSAIELVGPPMGKTVFCGEQEFVFRLQKGGVKMFRCFSSVVYHKRHEFSEVSMLGRTRHISKVPPWHTYYEIRNRIYTDLAYKRRTLLRSLLNTAVDSFIKIYTCDDKLATFASILRATYDGVFGRMGMRFQIPRPR